VTKKENYKKGKTMNLNSIDGMLDELMTINGAIASGVIDWESGMALGMKTNGNFDIELACAGNAEVIKAKMATMNSLNLDDEISDILITLSSQIHVISMVPGHSELAVYLALDSSKANLALARAAVRQALK
jgi:hypothetical protein